MIGVEFASVWKSFGADVTIVEALPRLVAAEDEASSKALERAFRKRGIDVQARHAVREGRDAPTTGVAVTLEGGETVEAELLLVAVGRGPITAGLGYEEQGVAMDRGFVLTDERLRTNVAGRLRRRRHRARPPAGAPRLPAGHLRRRGDRRPRTRPSIDEAGIPRVTYCDPEVASVGLTEAQAKEQYGADKVETFTYNLGGNGKSQILKTAGLRQAGPRRRTARSSASTWSAPGSAS